MAETPQSRLLRYKREIEADLNGRPRPTRRAVLATRGYLATGRVLGSGRYAKVLEATDYTGGFDDGRVAAKMIDLTKVLSPT